MITAEHLTKYYGDIPAVVDLSFTIGEGHVYGFLGPNGAGKSTTMNLMTGCLSATEGRVLIDGKDIFENPKEAKRRIGYLPEQPPLYLGETPEEYLKFVGEAKGLRGTALKDDIERVIQETGIAEMRHRRISALSKGYKQRVGIAQALLGNPRVIILDEPTVGLDPIQIIGIRDLIRDLGRSHTVIFSSHILSEVQTICDEILIIAHGKLVAFDTPEGLEKKLLSPGQITLVTDADPEAVQAALADIPHINSMDIQPQDEDNLLTVVLNTDQEDIHMVSRQVFQAFAGAGTDLLEMSLKKASLEDIFLELTEGTTPEEAEASEEANASEAAEEVQPAEAAITTTSTSTETTDETGEEEDAV